MVDADIGHACAFAGPLRHAGYPITRGTRFILVLFCYVEGFAYGELVNDYVAKHGCDGRPAPARVTLSAADMCRLVRASKEKKRQKDCCMSMLNRGTRQQLQPKRGSIAKIGSVPSE
eukprot:COSAG06_NODE_12461_length_1378_cov_3.037529_2_plen_117_part_00